MGKHRRFNAVGKTHPIPRHHSPTQPSCQWRAAYYVLLDDGGPMQTYRNMLHAYSDAAYRDRLAAFRTIETAPSLAGDDEAAHLFAIIATK